MASLMNNQSLTIHKCTPYNATSSVEVTLKQSSPSPYFHFGRPSESYVNVTVPGCAERLQSGATGSGASTFVSTGQHEDIVCQMLQSHLGGDFSLVGPRVCIE